MENKRYTTFLAVVAALGGFLFGYDAAVVSGTVSQVSSQFSLGEIQEGWFVGCALIGSIIGVLFAGNLSDRWGRKPTLLTAALFFTVSGLACALAPGFASLVVARWLGGIGIGIVSIVSPLYISEISPAKYRGRLVGLYQLAVTLGFLGAYLMNFRLLDLSTSGLHFSSPLMEEVFVSEVWRAMLGFCALPAILFFGIIFFIPESPRWLIAQRHETRALAILKRIYTAGTEARNQLIATRDVISGDVKANFKSLFRPGIRRAVVIGAAIAILGQFMGVNAVLYYGPTIFEEAGLSGGDALFSQVLVGIVNAVTTVLAIFIIDRFGRKVLVYYGVTGMIVALLLISLYFGMGESLGLGNSFLLVFFLAYVFCCAISISAVIFVFLSEMYPTSVRGMAMSVAGLSLWVGTYLIGQLTPWMLATLTPAGTFLFFACMCVPYILIVWKLMPETTGKTLEEIERFWAAGAGSESDSKSIQAQ